MKPIYYLLLPLCLFALTCGNIPEREGSQSTKYQESKNELPGVLEGKGSSIASYSSYRKTLVEEIYRDQMAAREDLRKLHDSIDELAEKSADEKEVYNEFVSKNTSYYSEANTIASGIKDEELKEYVSNLILQSETKYRQDIAEHAELINEIDALNASIQDFQKALKIVVTLPLIQEYQKQKKTEVSGLKEVVSLQKSVLNTEMSLVNN